MITVLFPALLFNSILRHPPALGSALPPAASGLAVVAAAVAAYALRWWPGSVFVAAAAPIDEALQAA